MKFDINEEPNVHVVLSCIEFHWLPIQNGGIVRVLYIHVDKHLINYFAGKEFCKLGHNNYT